jgi:outer membrane receptor protein involved in Fe transport
MYGSDAVAGVVNFVLRQDFNGLEATAQYGVATQGGARENRGALVYGRSWDSGNVITTYEHYGRASLPSSERSFSSGVQQPTDLLPDVRRDSVLLHLKQDVAQQSDLYLDALYSRNRNVDALTYGTTTYTIDTLSVAPGAEFALGGEWMGSFAGLYGLNHDHQQLIQPAGQTASAVPNWRDTLSSAEFKVDGPLFEAPGGLSKVAMGAGWRSESFAVPEENIQRVTRTIKDVFAELNIPLLHSSAKDTLTVNVAGRYERYSDFGQSTNPKVGLSWYPLSTLKIRATWGTSFRAPTLFSEYNPGFAYVFSEPDPKSPTGSTLTLARLGGNSQLGPEKSTTFTVGADYDCTTLPGFRTSVTYFNTDYRDRIGLVNGNPYTFLANEGLYPPPFLIRNPSLPFVQTVLQSVGPDNVYSLVGAYNPADISAYQDDRQVNSASYRQDGIDLNVRYNSSTGIGNLLSQVNAVYLFRIDQRTTATSSAVNLVNTLFYPVGIRFRASEDWSVGGWGSSVALNFTNRYQNNTVTPRQSVKAYATVDARTSYAFDGDTSRALSGLVLSVAVRNAFNTKPPFVHSSDFTEQPINYDPANADPIGRFITLQITKHW